MKSILKIGFFALVASLLLMGCDREEPMAPDTSIVLFQITDPVQAIGVIDGTNITVEVPFGTDVSNLIGSVTLPTGASISPDPASGIDYSGGSVTFTVTNEDASETYSVTVVEGPNPLRVALVGDAPSIEDLSNPEIKDAYMWAMEEYKEKAGYFNLADLTAEDIETAEVLWFHYVGENRELPASATGNAMSIINDYYKAGGDLLLTKHASQYLVNLGRLGADWGPTDGGANMDYDDPGFNQNPDDWGLGYQLNDMYDGGQNGSHPAFSDLNTKEVTFDGVTYDAIMLIDGGSKRDNGFFWFVLNIPGVIAEFDDNGDGGLGAYDSDGDGENDSDDRDTNGDGVYNNDDDVDALKAYFEAQTNSVVRGSFEWDPVANGVEFFTVVEFNADGDYQGRAFVIAPGAYEWYHNDGRTNAWRSNVEGITANVFSYFGVE